MFSFPCYKISFLVESLSFNYKSICITHTLQIMHSEIHLSHVCFVWEWKWQPTPVFLPGESQGRGSLVGCRLRGRTESDMTETT